MPRPPPKWVFRSRAGGSTNTTVVAWGSPEWRMPSPLDSPPRLPYLPLTMKCTICQTETAGAFCQTCGAPAEGAACGACSHELLAGANFCTSCGAPVRPAPARLPWIVAGASLVALAAVLLAPALRPGGGAANQTLGPAFVGSGPTQPGIETVAPGPLTGSPREQADRLFNRIMIAQEQGDLDQVAFFLPMGVLAYRQAGDLDDDGLYHLSLLETASGEPASGLVTADKILTRNPNHILALGAAAQAADALGDRDLARRHYSRILDVFQEERGRPLPEYLDHVAMINAYREEAEAYLGR